MIPAYDDPSFTDTQKMNGRDYGVRKLLVNDQSKKFFVPIGFAARRFWFASILPPQCAIPLHFSLSAVPDACRPSSKRCRENLWRVT